MMKRYFNIFGIIIALAALGTVSCTSDKDIDGKLPSKDYNLNIATRASADEVMKRMSLYTFYNDGGAYDQKFKRQLPATYANDRLQSAIETGFWKLAMVSPPVGTTITSPASSGAVMSSSLMYEYTPTVGGTGKSSDAAEIYTSFQTLPQVLADQTVTLTDVPVSRNMAMVEIIFTKATPNFTKPGTNHIMKLHDVPNKISYAGTLMPSAAAPSMLAQPLQSKVVFSDSSTYPGYFKSDTIKFIIPAHKGTDYLDANPADTIKTTMSLEVSLERAGGGSYFTKTKEIPLVAKCNKILRVNVTVDDGMEFTTEVLPWNEVNLSTIVGDEFGGWIYVKYGGTGSGLSWSDAMGSINTAVLKAKSLKDNGVNLQGVLVAGSTNTANYYNEASSEDMRLAEGTRIFGGWSGVPGTELTTADPGAPYKSAHRDLEKYKSRIKLSASKIITVTNNSLMDGFMITDVDSSANTCLVTVEAGGILNAFDISGLDKNRPYLTVRGLASNILYTNNGGNMTVDGGTLVNATIAKVSGNGSVTLNNATVVNSVFWGYTPTRTGTNNIQYSAFQGTLANTPAGTGNIHINATNTAWFSPTNNAPGPQFNLGVVAGRPNYKVNDSGRSPLLCRGDMETFSTYATFFPQGYETDILGKPRKWRTDPSLDTEIDMGCYEHGAGFDGFLIRWQSDKMYISAKGGYVNNLPLLIPNNEDPNTAVEVSWTATVISSPGASWSTFNGATVVPGTNVVVGSLKFTNQGSTPTNDYTESNERPWGQIKISTTLGGYMPDATIDILQVPGKQVEWTDGYAGSFHRNNERGARYISGYNSGPWSARIISGLEWIKIDQLGKYEGGDVTNSDDGQTPDGQTYKEVKEVWGGYIEGSGNIKFRVGMKSKNTTGTPRYGLIVITREEKGVKGSAMFFVRQGEDPDYLYRDGDTRRVNTGTETNPVYEYWSRTSLAKFSPYNVTDPNGSKSTTGTELTPATSDFVKYPSQIGYYFRWNQRTAYLEGTANSTSGSLLSWSDSREVCPDGYRHPTYLEYNHTIYYNVNDNTSVSPSAEDSALNFQWGAYADGFYDQVAPDPIPVFKIYCTNPTTGGNKDYNMDDNRVKTGEVIVANRGALMVSHYNYGSIFFPAAGLMSSNGSLLNSQFNWKTYCFYPTNYSYNVNTHWTYGHIGMSCSFISANATPVRCVKK